MKLLLAILLSICAIPASAGGASVLFGASSPVPNTITESTITVTLLKATTVQILQDGTTASWASIYPNAPLVMLGNANSYLQAVIQNLNNGTLAQSALVLTGDLGSDTSFYANVQQSNSRFSNPSFAVFPSSSMVMYASDAPVYVWADTNGGQYGGSGGIVFGSSNAVAANVSMQIMPATASGPGAIVSRSSVTISTNASIGYLLVGSASAPAVSTLTVAGIARVFEAGGSNGNGHLILGNNSTAMGDFYYDGDQGADLAIKNTWVNDGGDINFLTRAVTTPRMAITGVAGITVNVPMTLVSSSMTVNGNMNLYAVNPIVNQDQAANNVNASIYDFRKSRGTFASKTLVNSGDNVADIIGYGYDGTIYQNSSMIRYGVDSTPGANLMPGNISFWTTPQSASLSQRMVINSTGNVGINTTNSPATLLHMSSGTLTIDGTNSSINVAVSGTQSSFGQMISTGAGAPQFTIAPGANSNVSGQILIRDGAAAATSRDYAFTTTDQTVGDFSLKVASIKGAGLNTLAQNWTSSYTYIRSGMNFGIGAAAPTSALQINNSIAATGYSIKITSSDASVNFGVQGNGVIVSSSAVPSITCDAGTGVMGAAATNNWGTFTAGAAATNCAITFSGGGWPNNASCTVDERTSLVAVRVSAQSKTAFTAAGTTISNDVIAYHCDGN